MKSKWLFVFFLLLIVGAAAVAFFMRSGGGRGKHAPTGEVTPASVSVEQARAASSLRAEIARKEEKTGLRVMIFGWDSADWQIIDPLMARGGMRNLQKMLRNGTRAPLRSFQPMLSPLLWNTMATGKQPTEHGILDFLVIDPKSGKPSPMNSTFRKSMALWNMATEAGKTTAFVAWWATWPAEHINGTMVTDRVSYSLFSNIEQTRSDRNLTWPENYYSEIRPKLLSEKGISNQDLAGFIHMAPDEIAAERQKTYPEGKTNPVSYLAHVLASTRNYYTISRDLLSRHRYDLFSCYFESVDEVSHMFGHMTAPRMEMVTDEEFRRYKDVQPLFYEYIDRLTGDLMSFAGQDTVVILLSDHGFKHGAGRPTDFPPYISDRPAYWHREYGIYAMAGGPVRQGVSTDTVSVFDIAPTVLYLLGLPVGEDLHGKVLTDSLDPGFARRFPETRVASWEPLRTRPSAETTRTASARVDKEMMENLAALGYIGNAQSGQATSAFYRNLASIYLHEKKLDQADRQLQASFERGEVFESYELLYGIRKEQGRIDEAGHALEAGFNKFGKVPGESFDRLIDLYVENNRMDAAHAALQKYGPAAAPEKYRSFAEARVMEGSDQADQAEKQYLRILSQDPSFVSAMDRLYRMYKDRGELYKLEAPAREGLRMNDQLALYHNVLGVVYKRNGKLDTAVKEYGRAVELDPDNAVYWANLGAAYLSMQQPEQALQYLVRARSKDDKEPEVWLNLGAVYGSLGRNQEGLEAFQKARQLGAESPGVELGIAAIYAQEGDFARAKETVVAALSRYPNNPDLRDLAAALQQQQQQQQQR